MQCVRGGVGAVARRVSAIPTGVLGLAAGVVWIVSAIYMVHFGASWHLDLRVYRAAVRALFAGHDPFLGSFTANKLPFTYPPFALFVLSPLGLGPLGLVEGLWWLATSCALVTVLYLLLEAERKAARATDVARTAQLKRRSLAVAALLAAVSTLALEPVRSNMNYGQINVVLMLAIVVEITRPPARRRGVLVGLAAAVKLTPLIYLEYFGLSRARAAVARALGVFVLATAIAGIVLPKASVRYWFHEALDAKRTGDVGGVSNQSWEGLFNRAPFHGGAAATVGFVLFGVATIAASAPLVRRLLAQGRLAESVMALALVEVLVSPISWTHHWSWLVVAPLVVVSLWNRHRNVARLFVLLFLVAVAAPYWWALHGPIADLAHDSLVLTGAVTLFSWVIVESRGSKPPVPGEVGFLT